MHIAQFCSGFQHYISVTRHFTDMPSCTTFVHTTKYNYVFLNDLRRHIDSQTKKKMAAMDENILSHGGFEATLNHKVKDWWLDKF